MFDTLKSECLMSVNFLIVTIVTLLSYKPVHV